MAGLYKMQPFQFTNAAELSNRALAGASNTYSNMDKKIDRTETTTAPKSNVMADIMPAIGSIVGVGLAAFTGGSSLALTAASMGGGLAGQAAGSAMR